MKLRAEGLVLGALGPLDLNLRSGECLGLWGPAGVGKTQLLEALLGLRKAGKGRVSREPDSAAFRRACAYVAQQVPAPRARPAVDVRSYLRAACRLKDWDEAALGRALALAAPVSPEQPLRELSPGAWRRIELARALGGEPALVVIDDPDAHFDDDTLVALGDGLDALRDRGGTALLAASQRRALERCDRVIALPEGALL